MSHAARKENDDRAQVAYYHNVAPRRSSIGNEVSDG